MTILQLALLLLTMGGVVGGAATAIAASALSPDNHACQKCI
jgi:hypothetical protein